MLTRKQKFAYFSDALLRSLTVKSCPACGAKNSSIIDRKHFVTTLNECHQCGIYYRHPVDSAATNKDFYQAEYTEGDGITTFMPPAEELAAIVNGGFSQFPSKDAKRLKPLFKSLFPRIENIKILDYGSSWGYTSHQLKSYGMDVQSYEISRPRAEYGNQALGLSILTDESKLRVDNDLFFSSHVIEHVPNAIAMLALAKSLTAESGYVVTLCPNGSPEFRAANPAGFHGLWGKVHPNFLNAKFFRNVAGSNPYFITSTVAGWGRLASWDKKSQVADQDLASDEILFVWRPHVQAIVTAKAEGQI